MILPTETQEIYKELGYGTLREIMNLTGITNTSHASNIMSGKAGTRITNIAKIQKFIQERNALKNQISNNDQN